MKKRYNVLITSAGKRVALLNAFKETLGKLIPDARVYTTELNPLLSPAGALSDGCFKVPRVTEEGYIDCLYEICKENEVGLVVPTIDTELLVLAQNREKFVEIGCSVIVSDYDFISLCRDKRKTGAFFAAKGIRVPEEKDKDNPVFPMFAKPYDGSLSKDIYLLRSVEDITPEVRSNPKLMFMEYIDKTKYSEYTVDLYYNAQGELMCLVPRERLEIRAGEINKDITRKNFVCSFLAEKLKNIAGARGCICAQFFYCAENDDVVGIEINPRFGGGYPLSYAAGANYPGYLIREYLMGEAVEPFGEWSDAMLMLRYDDAVFVKDSAL